MFEKFDKSAVGAVHTAVRQAHQLDAPVIDEEHLLLGLLHAPGSTVTRLLGGRVDAAGVTESLARARRRGGLSDPDVRALRDLGIDVSELTSRLEQRTDVSPTPRRRSLFGRHIRFSAAAKGVLAGALTEAAEHRSRRIGERHVLLAILRRGGLAAGVLAEHGVDYESVQRLAGKA